MEGETTALAAVSPIAQLETALRDNGVHVSAGAIQQFLDQRKWIYHSQRVNELLEELDLEQLYSVFNTRHHVTSATLLFEFLKSRRCAVVYGHKAVGKTQLLFFVFKLLQAMGEKVMFLDRTILPAESNKIEIDSDMFCGNQWKDSFQIEGPVKTALNKFLEDAHLKSFQDFFFELRKYARSTQSTGTTQSTRNSQSPQSSKTRVWVIVDEVVLFKNVIKLPEEQDFGPFKWLVTGSAGIGSWVFTQHLEKLLVDLPTFTEKECYDFANKLCKSMRINLAHAIDGVPPEGIEDWLEERFGGVIGYVAEMFLGIAKNNPDSVSQYMSNLSDRISEIISNSAGKNFTKEQLAKDWLNEIKSGKWNCLRNAGLCGKEPPRGIVFKLILESLCEFSPEEDELRLVI